MYDLRALEGLCPNERATEGKLTGQIAEIGSAAAEHPAYTNQLVGLPGAASLLTGPFGHDLLQPRSANGVLGRAGCGLLVKRAVVHRDGRMRDRVGYHFQQPGPRPSRCGGHGRRIHSSSTRRGVRIRRIHFAQP